MERRAELLNLISVATNAAATVELDQQVQGRLSRMDALQRQEMAKAMIERRRLEITKIDAALSRMDEGEFGFCLVCGDSIPEKRLDLDPTIAVCVGCAK
jgi:DnaK suppressor protein